ncbi:MAG: MATE family efflux transporter, partial [Prevotella sp.]|nr:MATE family efflux transporter [Prevotella sp.]
QIDRLMQVVKLSIISATCIMTVGWLIAMFIPEQCARLFTTDPELIKLSSRAIRINMICFPVIGFQMVTTNFFQCIGKAKLSIFLSLSRQLLFLLPLIAVLPRYFGVDGVWFSLPTADAIAAVVASILMTSFMRKLKKQTV